MKRIIICPHCGVVRRYAVKETVTRSLLYDADGNSEGATEDVCLYGGKVKRCLCGRIVKIHEIEDGEEHLCSE